jgi:hypothetical protein
VRAWIREALSPLDGLFEPGEGLFHAGLLLRGQQLSVRGQRLLRGQHHALRLHARLHQLATLEVVLPVLEGREQHRLDLLVGEAVGRLHLHLLLDARLLLLGVTLSRPSASTRNVTSSRASPAGIGGMPSA